MKGKAAADLLHIAAARLMKSIHDEEELEKEGNVEGGGEVQREGASGGWVARRLKFGDGTWIRVIGS